MEVIVRVFVGYTLNCSSTPLARGADRQVERKVGDSLVHELKPEEHLDIFLRVHRTVGLRLAQMFAEAGAVPPSEARVLTVISRYPGHRLRMDELAQELGMTKGAVSRIVDRLVSSGYVERQASNADRRGVFAAMTADGREALRHVTSIFRLAFNEVFGAGLSRDELTQMTSLLQKLDEANDAAKRVYVAAKLSEDG